MKVLITSPSLDISENVSGISSVVNIILSYNKEVTYIHHLAGKKDNETSFVKRILDLLNSYKALINLLRDDSYELLHLNLPLNPKSIFREFVLFLINRFYNKPILTHLHGGKFLTQIAPFPFRIIIRYILRKSNIVLALSDLEKFIVEKNYKIQNVKVLSNSIWYPNEYEKVSKIEGQIINLLFLGRLHESKGLNIIIEAIEILNKKGLGGLVKLRICGQGPLEDFIIKKVKQLGNINFMGVVKGETKLKVLCSSDIFLLPSLYGEGLPVALLEAMSFGVVPIVTNDGSMNSVVESQKNGIIVKSGDAVDLSRSIESLIFNRSLVSNLSNEARRSIKSKYDINSYIKTLNQYYFCCFKSKVF